MLSVTPPVRFPSPFSFALRTRPLGAAGRQRIEALLWAGREAAAVTAYRQVTHAPYRTAVRAVGRMKARLDVPA